MGVIDGRVAIITGGGARHRRVDQPAVRQRRARRWSSTTSAAHTDGTGGDAGPGQARSPTRSSRRAARAVADGGDIGDVATGERLVDTAVEQFGKLDIVVNVAGILRDRMIFNLTEQDWDAVIRVHLKGHYSTVRPASAYWREQRNPEGHYRVINFTSVSGPRRLARPAELRGRQDGHRRPHLLPGPGPGPLRRHRQRDRARRRHPAHRHRPAGQAGGPRGPAVGGGPAERSPDNIAPVALYLASEQSDWLTGRVDLLVRATRSACTRTRRSSGSSARPRRGSTTGSPAQLEGSFRPAADGLPFSLFASQLKTN